MTSFDNREKAFENKFAYDQDLKFKAEVRRDRLVGAWAAKLLGLSGEAAGAYVQSMVKADMQEPGDADVFRKLRQDFDAKGIKQSDHQIRRQMDEFLAEAVSQIENERK